MQELKIVAWCDVCHGETRAMVEATSRYVLTIKSVGRPGAAYERGLDLCDIHAEPVQQLYIVLKRFGTVPPKEQAAAVTESKPTEPPQRKSQAIEEVGTRRCPLCDAELHKWTLVRHLYRVHQRPAIPQPKKCPDCGSRQPMPASMVRHRTYAHGYDHIAEVVGRKARAKR